MYFSRLICKSKIMKILLLSLMTFCVVSANAQKEKKEAFEEKFVKMDMAQMPIAEFPDDAIAVSGIRIMQNLNDSVRMGYGHKGPEIRTLIFKKPVTEILQKQVNRMYKHEYKKNGATLFWVINDLRFGAKLSADDYSVKRFVPGAIDCSFTRFNADAYISADGSLFKKVCTIDTVFLILNIPSGHGTDLENALRVLLRKTLLTGKDVLENKADELTIEQIAYRSAQKPGIPIVIDSNYREGAYANFAEFLANNPSIKNYETVPSKKKRVTIVSAAESNNKDTLNVWGVCKNGEIYKYHQEYLIPIEKQGNGFIISGYVEKTSRRNNNYANASLAAAWGGVYSGLPFLNVGVTISAVILSGKPLLVDSIPYIDEKEKQPVATCIDMRTGNFSF